MTNDRSIRFSNYSRDCGCRGFARYGSTCRKRYRFCVKSGVVCGFGRPSAGAVQFRERQAAVGVGDFVACDSGRSGRSPDGQADYTFLNRAFAGAVPGRVAMTAAGEGTPRGGWHRVNRRR